MEITRPDHISIWVKDVVRSIQFYKELGFRQTQRPDFDFPGAWFQISENFWLHLIGGRHDEKQYGGSRQNHLALKVTDFKATAAFVQAKGIVVRGPKQRPDGHWQVFIEDLDGHVWEFTAEDE